MLEFVRDLHEEERARTLEIGGAQGFLLGRPGPVPRADPGAPLVRSPAIARP